jgi:hypothetical protein
VAQTGAQFRETAVSVTLFRRTADRASLHPSADRRQGVQRQSARAPRPVAHPRQEREDQSILLNFRQLAQVDRRVTPTLNRVARDRHDGGECRAIVLSARTTNRCVLASMSRCSSSTGSGSRKRGRRDRRHSDDLRAKRTRGPLAQEERSWSTQVPL